MKWTKHFNDFLDSPEAQHILSKHGYAGIYAYFKMEEILAKHFNPDDPENFLENKRWFLANLLPLSDKRTAKKILDTLRNLNLIWYEYRNQSIKIETSIIKDLADEYSQKIMKSK